MKKTKTGVRIALILTAVLLALLIFLTVSLIAAFRQNSARAPDFDLMAVTADRSGAATDISSCLLPEFAGVTSGGSRWAIVGSEYAMRELCSLIYPALSEAMEEGTLREGNASDWKTFADAESSVYLRWHTELPDAAAALFASGDGSGRAAACGGGYQSEAFLIPYVRGGNTAEAALRSVDGTVRLLTVTMPKTILAVEDLTRFVRSFRNSLSAFVFRESGEDLQPVVTERISARCILMTRETASFILDSTSERNALLILFGLSPDKLLSARAEPDGGTSFVESRGELYTGASHVRFRSASDNGIGLQSLIGYADNVGLAEYIQASLKIFEGIRSVNRWLAGGDAQLLLTGAYASDGIVRLSFSYSFDNIIIAVDEEAFAVTFEEGHVSEVSLYTVAVRNQGSRESILTGSWFCRWIEAVKGTPGRISLAYPADFISEFVAPVWSGEFFREKE